MPHTNRARPDLKPRDHVTPALHELHWFPVVERIKCRLCLLVHTTLISHTPDYLTNLLTPASDVPSRSSLPSSSRKTWSSREQDGRSATGRSLWQHPVPGINCQLSRLTPAFRRHLKSSVFLRFQVSCAHLPTPARPGATVSFRLHPERRRFQPSPSPVVIILAASDPTYTAVHCW